MTHLQMPEQEIQRVTVVRHDVPDFFFLWQALAQHILSPPAHAHYVKPLACKDDLLHRLPVGTFALQIIAHIHPADFAIRGADDQHHGVCMLLPIIGNSAGF